MKRPSTNTGETNVTHLLDDIGTVVTGMREALGMIAQGYCFRGPEREDLSREEMQRIAADAGRIADGLDPESTHEGIDGEWVAVRNVESGRRGQLRAPIRRWEFTPATTQERTP